MINPYAALDLLYDTFNFDAKQQRREDEANALCLTLLQDLMDALKEVDTLKEEEINQTLKESLTEVMGQFAYPKLSSMSCLNQDVDKFAADFFFTKTDILLQSIDQGKLRMPKSSRYVSGLATDSEQLMATRLSDFLASIFP